MSRTGHGERRYPARPIRPGGHMVLDGQDLGAAMTPNDLLISIKRVAVLDDDEILSAFADGVAYLSGLPADAAIGEWLGLPEDEREAALDDAASTTKTRIKAWRTRNRLMTWGTLRVLLRGLSCPDVSIHAGPPRQGNHDDTTL